jgi:hypothetical protein
MRETVRAVVGRLWKRRGFRRLVFSVGLLVQLSMVGFALGWTLTSQTGVRTGLHREHATVTRLLDTIDRDSE